MTGALFDVPTPKADDTQSRAVYQGTSKAIRYLEQLNADPKLDAQFGTRAKPEGRPGAAWAARFAGTIAQARSLAASIDRASGSDPKRRQAAGRDLADMHERLDALMLRLDPEEVTADAPEPFDQLTAELQRLELEQRRRVMEGGQL